MTGRPTRRGLPPSVVIPLAEDDANLLWDQRLTRVTPAVNELPSRECSALLWRSLETRWRVAKQSTAVKVTADESEMKVKRGKVQNEEIIAMQNF